MTLFTPVTNSEWAQKLGIPPVESDSAQVPAPSPWGLAELIRREISRNTIVTRQELRNRLERTLQLAGYGDHAWPAIRNMTEKLVDIGELVNLKVSHQCGYVAAPNRWIRLTRDRAVYLGVTEGVKLSLQADHPLQFVRRFHSEERSIRPLLREWNIREQSLEDWIGPPGWRKYLTEVNDANKLDSLWEEQLEKLESEGSNFLIHNTLARIVGGSPGDFFGKPNQTAGRWRSPGEMPDGYYLGVQPGHQDNHWRPILVSLKNGAGRSVFLDGGNNSHDSWDLFRWLLIAHGVRKGQQEVTHYDHQEQCLRSTFSLPNQIDRLLQLAGESLGKSRYHLTPDEQWKELFHQFFPGVKWY